MKTLVISLLILSVSNSIAQSFHSLNGTETSQNTTILFYRLGDSYISFNPVYRYDIASSSEEMIMDAYYSNFPGGELARAVLDFEFFPGDSENFINVGYQINPDNHTFIARNDSIVLDDFGQHLKTDISKQDPMKVFVFGSGGPVRSWDGGYTFPVDSINPVAGFIPISLADFDDNVFFGVDEEYNLSKNGVLVDTSKIFWDHYTVFLYDINQYHIYRTNRTAGGYTFHVSSNRGNAYTWTKTYQSDRPIIIDSDRGTSGLVYLANGKNIYESTNNGYNFTLYRRLPSDVAGLYKKPSSDILYAATRNVIYEIHPDTMIVIKSLPLPPDIHQWFPLNIGNRWVYSSYWIQDNQGFPPTYTFAGTRYMNVTGDTIINNKSYFILENDILNQMVFEPRMYLRVDSITGEIFRYWTDLNNEFLFHNLNAEIGDTVYHPQNSWMPFYVLQDEFVASFWNEQKPIREYMEFLPCGCGHSLVKGLGLGYAVFNEFGGAEDQLKGAVINGVVYGDTSFVVSIKDDLREIPSEFVLYQNYPNPFNPSTTIRWQSPVGSHHTLKVYDLLGREVATLVNEYKPAGSYEVEFNASQLSSGVYLYKLTAGEFTSVKKLMLLK